MKKIISLALSLAAVICIFAIASVTASAAIKESEGNDSYINADIISLGETVTGKLSATGDKDFYKVDVSEKGYLLIRFTNPFMEEHCKWRVTVFSATAPTDEISSHTISAISTNTILPKIGIDKGTYYISVTDGRYGWGYVDNVEYGFSVEFVETEYWETESNDKYTVADKIVTDKKYGGFILNTDDKDYYEINFEEEGYIKIDFENETSTNTSAKWRVNVYKLSDGVQLIHEHVFSATRAKTTLPRIGVNKGTYFIEVSDGRYGWGDIDNLEYAFSADFTPTECWESEINGEYTVADKLIVDKKFGGFLYHTFDFDYFKVDIDKKGYIKIDFENELSTDTSAKWLLKVYTFEDDLQVIHEQSIKATTAKTELPRIGVEKGTYYISISDGNDGWGQLDNLEYRFTANFTETEYWESENNGEYTVADNLIINNQYGGFLYHTFDSDYFELNVTEKGSIQINFENDISTNTSAEWEIKVYKPENELKVIYKQKIKATTIKTELPEINVEKGIYYISISDGNSGWGHLDNLEYRFTVTEKGKKIIGDVNFDGQVTAADARLALRASVGLENLSAQQIAVADIDKKSGVTAADARLILRASVGLEKL